jgi:outer membrane protein TolC
MGLKRIITAFAWPWQAKTLIFIAAFALVTAAGVRAQQTPPPASPNPPAPLPSQSPLVDSIPLPAPQGTPQESIKPLLLDEAVKLALRQASAFDQAGFNERIAAEDVRQARAAFLPRVAAVPSVIYTSPAIGVTKIQGTPREPSFLGANAVTEYQGLFNFSGELDTAGRLHATLRRNVALLEAARAGTESARRTLTEATEEAYYGLALATERRIAAEQNVAAAAEFERTTALQVSGGEAAPVDQIRARLQTTVRRDELEQARAAESVAADSLRVLVGYDFTQPITTTELLLAVPETGEIERFTADAIARRPEFRQFAAERRAALEEIRAARAERLPQLTYSVNGGFISDSLRPPSIKEHTGVSATVGVSIPLLDWGASRSRERQAELRAAAAESARVLAERNLAQTFFSARAQAVTAAARIRLARTSIIDAEQNLVASIARYRAGEAQIIEVTDAQNTLIAQRTALYQAIFDYQVARARLRQATGQ